VACLLPEPFLTALPSLFAADDTRADDGNERACSHDGNSAYG
jgi:hypothetical protein